MRRTCKLGLLVAAALPLFLMAMEGAVSGRIVDNRNRETAAAVEVTLPSGEKLLVARPDEGEAVTLFARGASFIVTHDGSVTNLADTVDEKGAPR